MNMTRIEELASELLMNKKSHPWKEIGNKYHHGIRTAKIALALRRLMFPEDNSHDEILTAAALFHDVANSEEGYKDHGKAGAIQVRGLLADFCSEAELNEICHIIEVHDDRKSERRHGYSNWVKLHQDADYLDHAGTYDIWMNCIQGSVWDQTAAEAAEYMANKRIEELSNAHKLINYAVSHKILDEKIEYQRQFAVRFSAEMAGEIIDLDRLWAEAK